MEDPIRAEIFSVERLEQHAESLAAAQIVTSKSERGRQLAPRVLENGRALLESCQAIARAIHPEHTITPAAEWLVDNFRIVDSDRANPGSLRGSARVVKPKLSEN